LKVLVSKIQENGLDVEESLDARLLDMDSDLVKVNSPLQVHARFTKDRGTVFVEASVNGRITSACVRCLEDYESTISVRLKLAYGLGHNMDVIDITDEIRGEFILQFPVKPLCREDCKGLCVKCGKDLNKGRCMCEGGDTNAVT
jgi:uncharacterized protein